MIFLSQIVHIDSYPYTNLKVFTNQIDLHFLFNQVICEVISIFAARLYSRT